MKKKLLSILSALVLAFSTSAFICCGGDTPSNGNENGLGQITETEQPTGNGQTTETENNGDEQGEGDNEDEEVFAPEITDCAFTSFSAQDFKGTAIVDESVFADYKVTMINVWGTYCEPCKVEMPELAELNSEYAEQGFQIIGIPIDGETKRQKALEIIEQTQADYRHLRVSTSLKSFISAIKSVPYTIFVTEDGRQIGEPYVGSKSKADWKKLIDQMLEFIDK